MNRIGLLCILLLCFISTQTLAQESVGESGELSGRVFADFYWIAQNHNSALEGENGFWFRRIYLTYERDLGGAFSSRLRLEMSSPGDFQSDFKMSPVVKDAYLKWQNDQHQVLAGISSTPTWGVVEDVWGYRSVEKSPHDLFGFGSSRDLGLAAKGQIDENGRLNYHIFLGNGNSNGAELNEGKKLMLSLGSNVTENLVIEGYADINSLPGGDIYTTHGFIGYQSEAFNIGGLYAYQFRENSIQEEVEVASLFTNFKLSSRAKALLRADHMFGRYIGGADNSYIPFDPTSPESTFLVGGIDVLLGENIHLIPNIEAIIYGDSITDLESNPDLIPRVTLFYRF